MFQEQPGEMAWGHARVGRQCGRVQVVVQMARNVLDELSDHVVLECRGGGEQAHLCLVSRSLQVGDQVPRHLAGELGAVIIFDEGEGEIQGAGDAGRRVNVPVADVDGMSPR